MRSGIGHDVHRLAGGRPLVLGGVEVPNDKGLLGHSDADVLLHAVMDALLGAAGMGDIGVHFPDTDPAYRGKSSRKLLAEVVRKLSGKGLSAHNVDCVVVAQAPKLAPYIPEMRRNIAQDLGLPEEMVNVKATTTEGLGPCGRGEGMAAYAVCTLTESGRRERG